jgi:hypothetical protein
MKFSLKMDLGLDSKLISNNERIFEGSTNLITGAKDRPSLK